MQVIPGAGGGKRVPARRSRKTCVIQLNSEFVRAIEEPRPVPGSAKIHDRKRATNDKRSHLQKQYDDGAPTPNVVRGERGNDRAGSAKKKGQPIQTQQKISAHEFGYAFELLGRVIGRRHRIPFYRALVEGESEMRRRFFIDVAQGA